MHRPFLYFSQSAWHELCNVIAETLRYVDFTAPYCQIEATYAVASDSKFAHCSAAWLVKARQLYKTKRPGNCAVVERP